MSIRPDQENGKLRKVLNNELKFLRTPNANVSVIVRIIGTISETQLKNALSKAQVMHPLLSARVVFDNDHIAWFYEDNVPEIPLKVVKRISDYHFIKVIQNEHKIPFDIFTGPLIRFILLQSNDISDIIVFCLHTICDGTALANLLRDILTFIANPNMEIKTIAPPQLSLSALSDTKSKGRIKNKLKSKIFNSINSRWKKDSFYIEGEEFKKLRDTFWEHYIYDVVLLELTREKTKEFNQLCKEHEITINSALTTAFYIAYQEVFGQFKNNQKKIAIPYDLRTRINTGNEGSFGLFVGSIIMKFKYNHKKGFWENAQMFHKVAVKKINSRKVFTAAANLENLEPSLIEGFITLGQYHELKTNKDPRLKKLENLTKNKKNVAVKISNKFKSALPGMTTTNLGRLNYQENFGDLIIDKMYFAPSAGRSIPLIIGAVGVSGKLTLTLNMITEKDEINIKIKKMEEVKQRALNYLGI
ncbi:MAG: hypothetical protein ACFFAQ_02790 [Promethearchaeota archaeon]